MDPLEKFRRKGSEGSTTGGQERKTGEKEKYTAYGTSSEEKRHLVVRLKFPQPSEAPSYSYLKNVIGDERGGYGVTLDYALPMVIDIKGRNLQELFKLLKDWKIEFVREFDPDECVEPEDPKQPVITSIEIVINRPEEPPPREQRH